MTTVKISFITYQMGTMEARLLIKLLSQYQARVEKEYAAPIGVAMPDAVQCEYDMAIDMHNDLLKLL